MNETIQYIKGYKLAMEDILRDMETVTTLEELREIIERSLDETNETLTRTWRYAAS